MHPFMVTIDPANNATAAPCSHQGQEFNIVVEGRVELYLSHKILTLETGDSVMFNARLPHLMRALDGKQARFLAIITQ